MNQNNAGTHGLRVPLGADTCRSEEEDLAQSILMIITTLPQTRALEPLYGCDLRSFLFRPVTPELLSQIRYVVSESLQQWETRLGNRFQIEVEPRLDDAQLLIRVHYQSREQTRTVVIEWNGGSLADSRRISS